MIRVAIAEDHKAMADGIHLLLEYEEYISIVGIVDNGEDLLKLVRLKQPQVVLTDIKMPKMNGITATKTIKKEFPNIKVVAFSMLEKEATVSKMIDAGVSGYLLKNSPLKEVLSAIVSVSEGKEFFDANIDHLKISEKCQTLQIQATALQDGTGHFGADCRRKIHPGDCGASFFSRVDH